jgi:hypothetical protein
MGQYKRDMITAHKHIFFHRRQREKILDSYFQGKVYTILGHIEDGSQIIFRLFITSFL